MSVDFWPTIAELAAQPLPKDSPIDGVSLLPVLRNPDARLERDAIYWHFPHYHHSRPAGAIRARDWKLIEFYDETPAELYHLAEDLSEKQDLAAAQPDRVARMKAQLAAWRSSVNAVMPTPNPNYDPRKSGHKGKRKQRETAE